MNFMKLVDLLEFVSHFEVLSIDMNGRVFKGVKKEVPEDYLNANMIILDSACENGAAPEHSDHEGKGHYAYLKLTVTPY